MLFIKNIKKLSVIFAYKTPDLYCFCELLYTIYIYYACKSHGDLETKRSYLHLVYIIVSIIVEMVWLGSVLIKPKLNHSKRT